MHTLKRTPKTKNSRHGTVLGHSGMPKAALLDLPVTKGWSSLPQMKHQRTKFKGHSCAHVHRLTIGITSNLAKNRGTNLSSQQEKLSWSLSDILKMMGGRRCIGSISISSFTAGAQLELRSGINREPRQFSPGTVLSLQATIGWKQPIFSLYSI